MAKRAKVITRKEDACCPVVAAMYDEETPEQTGPQSSLPPLPTGKNTRLLQAEIELPLYEAVKAEMKERGVSMRVVVTWCLEVFLMECRREAAQKADIT